MKKIIFVIFLLTSFLSAAKFGVYGVGSLPCAKFIKYYNESKQDKIVFDQFLYGYFTGLESGNTKYNKMLFGEDLDGMQLFNLNYCRNNPRKHYINSLIHLQKAIYLDPH